jgi:cobalt-zinc-cadmium efflux system outer membrane protein
MSFMRVTAACAAVLLFHISFYGQGTPIVISIDEAVRAALSANREYLAARERVAEAQALLRQAGLRPQPAIEVEAATGALTGSSGDAEYSAAYFHTFETGDKRGKRIAIARLGVALAEAEVQERERLLAAEVRARFVASAAEQLKLAAVRSFAPLTDESYKLTMRRVELGDAAPLEQQLWFAEANRIQAQQAVFAASSDAALVELKIAVGAPKEHAFETIPSLRVAFRPVTLAELQEHALNHRPDLRVLKLLGEQSAAETNLAQAEARANITGSARYTRSSVRFHQFGFSESGAVVPIGDTHNILTFGVSIPLFGGRRAGPLTDAARSRETQQRLRREHLARTIPQEVEAAYRRWNGAMRAVELLRSGVVEPSQATLTVIREAYRLGQLRLFDVLNEQRRLFDQQMSYIEAQAEAARAYVELERAVGGNLP